MTASIFEMTQEDSQEYEPRFEGEDSDEDSIEKGCIATYLMGKSEQDQCDAADALFKAIKDKGLEDLFALNSVEAQELRMAALVSMPNSGMIQRLFKKGFMEKQMDALSTGIQQNQADTELEVMMLAPVPAYLAMDAVEKAVPAGRVLERLGEHHEKDKGGAATATYYAGSYTGDGKTKWSDCKINYLLRLCAKKPSNVCATNWSQLPAWMKEVAEESDSHQQLAIIREQLKDNKIYQVNTANNPDLLDYIWKMQFAGIDGVEHPTLHNASKQLSPYLCSNLTDTQLSNMIAIQEAVEAAYYVTVQDNERMVLKAVPTTPGTYQDFVDMLKIFANTIFALFGANCTLYENRKNLGQSY